MADNASRAARWVRMTSASQKWVGALDKYSKHLENANDLSQDDYVRRALDFPWFRGWVGAQDKYSKNLEDANGLSQDYVRRALDFPWVSRVQNASKTDGEHPDHDAPWYSLRKRPFLFVLKQLELSFSRWRLGELDGF